MKIRKGFVSNSSSSSFIAPVSRNRIPEYDGEIEIMLPMCGWVWDVKKKVGMCACRLKIGHKGRHKCGCNRTRKNEG